MHSGPYSITRPAACEEIKSVQCTEDVNEGSVGMWTHAGNRKLGVDTFVFVSITSESCTTFLQAPSQSSYDCLVTCPSVPMEECDSYRTDFCKISHLKLLLRCVGNFRAGL